MKRYLPLVSLPFLFACAAGVDPNDGFGGSGGSGTHGLGGSGGVGDGTGGTGAGVTAAPLATGLSITEIAVFQGVKIDVMKGGVATTPAAVVAGRRALVRVYAAPGAGYVARPVDAILTLTTAGQPHTFTSKLMITGASVDDSWGSTFNFDVDAASIATDTTYTVRLQDPLGTPPGDPTAQYPTNGTPIALGAQNTGPLKISLFPIQFTAAGTGTAATGAADIAAYTASVQALYPTAAVQITVEAPLSYGGAVPQANGSNWGQLLNAMVQKRGGDPSPDVYYFGAFAPEASFNNFCGNGCVAGLSSIPQSPSDSGQKASIGLVYGGNSFYQEATGQTMAHEVGHGHGREHSPTTQSVQGCSQPSGIDPSYPYPQGDIGVWGYDTVTMKQYAPTGNYDLMGYCQTIWISDYTYKALFSWMQGEGGAEVIGNANPTTYRQLVVEIDGTLSVGESFPVYGLLSGVEHEVTFEDNGVKRTVIGRYYPYDHLPGGYVLVPEPKHFTAVRVPSLSTNTARPAP